MTSLFAEKALLPDEWATNVRVVLDGAGRIASVERDTSPDANDHRLTGRVLLPAPINLHSHAFQRALAGITESRGPDGQDSFWTWRRLMYAFLDALTPDHIQAITAMAQMEMLEAGFAGVVEFHYVHNQPGGRPYDDPAEICSSIFSAGANTGIGLALLPVYYAQGGIDGRPLEGGQLRFGNTLDSFSRLFSSAQKNFGAFPADYRLGVAPHSLRAVSADDLAHLIETYREGPIHIHAAEQPAEVEEAIAAYGKRPIAWLLENAQIDQRWCLVHATHMIESEITALAACGAVAGLCPLTEANLGDGIFPAVSFLDQGGTIGIGTDSNILIDLAQELRSLEYSQRLRDRARSVLSDPSKSTGRYLFDKICIGGAQAAGRFSGAIKPGSWADLMTLDRNTHSFAGLDEDQLLDSWIFATNRPMVRDLWSAGRLVVKDGRHIRRETIETNYRKVITELRTLM